MKKLSLFLIALTMLLSCKPEIEKPTVVTKSVGEITKTSAKVVGQVVADGGAEVTERGICWSTSQNPTIEDDKTTEGYGVGSFTSQILDLVSNTQYYVRAYATNEVGTSYGDEKSFTTLSIEGTTDGHSWVDLGLPSGKKWATCNVGASSPEEYGDYYAWGETTTKDNYSSSNCPTYGLTISELQSQGYIDSEGNLTAQYDAATANWGGSWRMPTKAEMQELLDNCTWTWTTQEGVNGYKVTSKVNSNYIFLPAAGYHVFNMFNSAGSGAHFWSSTPDSNSDSDRTYYLGFNSDKYSVNINNRILGQSIRPVLE